jgi:hypothetical protein
VSPASHTGRLSHHSDEPTAGREPPSHSQAAYAPNSAVRCHRNTVITTPLAAMTTVHTRLLWSQRVRGSRTSRARPTSQPACASRATVGGFMFDTASPGIPTIDTGYAPPAVSAATVPRPPRTIATPIRRVASRVPSA